MSLQHLPGALGQLQGVIHKEMLRHFHPRASLCLPPVSPWHRDLPSRCSWSSFPLSLQPGLSHSLPRLWGAAAPLQLRVEQPCCPTLPEARIISGERTGCFKPQFCINLLYNFCSFLCLGAALGGRTKPSPFCLCCVGVWAVPPDTQVGKGRKPQTQLPWGPPGQLWGWSWQCPVPREQGGDRATALLPAGISSFQPHANQQLP